jgi:hypothetical protein
MTSWINIGIGSSWPGYRLAGCVRRERAGTVSEVPVAGGRPASAAERWLDSGGTESAFGAVGRAPGGATERARLVVPAYASRKPGPRYHGTRPETPLPGLRSHELADPERPRRASRRTGRRLGLMLTEACDGQGLARAEPAVRERIPAAEPGSPLSSDVGGFCRAG